MTVGSLFAGIGGFDLGFERAGFEIKWQVEIDPFCRAVLAKHWPHVRRYEDVQEVHATGRGYFYTCQEPGWCEDCLEPVDVICGGFPCQDISHAGAGAGIDGERSGLWREYARIVRELRPRYVVVENVAALLDRGMGKVLGDLAESGYDAEWQVVPARAVGAPHERERVWIIAYPAGNRLEGNVREAAAQTVLNVAPQALAAWDASGSPFGEWQQLLAESGVCRVADGFARRVDRPKHRLKALGNGVLPQITQWIAERIREAECR